MYMYVLCCTCTAFVANKLHHYTQMMHGSEWTLKYDESEVENVARGHSQSATFSTGGHHVSMLHERPWFICFVT